MDLNSALHAGQPFTVEEAFSAGDYILPALHGVPSQWQHHAARGMIVDPLAGAAALASFEEPDARFFRAICAWIGGDEILACQLLEKLNFAHARNLLSLIRQERIEVLAQIPPVRGGCFVLRDGIRADKKFSVRHIGADQGDLSLDIANGRIMGCLDPTRPPSFFLCPFVEGQKIPLDLGDLPCPTIGATTDFDVLISTTAPWLCAFDHTITCDNLVQWSAVRRITGRPCYAYPLLYGIPSDLPPPDDARDIDIFMSGSLFTVREPDKARFVIDLTKVAGSKALLIDGALPYGEYCRMLARARVTPCFNRFPGGMLTRALEALAMGSIALVPEGSVHLLWGDESNGVFVYDQLAGPAPQVERILRDYSKYSAGCLSNVNKFRQSLKAETVASRLFRFATVVAARPTGGRDQATQSSLSHRRSSFIPGFGDLGTPFDSDVALTTADQLARLDTAAPAAHWHDEAARELLLAYGLATYRRLEPPKLDILLHPALNILENAVRVYPDRLTLRFNLMRMLFRFGNQLQRERGVALAHEIIERPEEEWQIDPLDDIYPFDFNGDSVNTRGFCDSAVLHLAGAGDQRARLRDLVRASVFHLLAVASGRADYAKRAVSLDGKFPHYRLTLAKFLIAEGSDENCETARRILEELVETSYLAGNAEALLQSIPKATSRYSLTNLNRSLVLPIDHRERFDSAFALSGHFRRGGSRGTVVHQQRRRTKPALISIIVCGKAAAGVSSILATLDRQDGNREHREIVYVDCFDEPPQAILSHADVVLSCGQNGILPFPLVALNQALDLTTAPVAVIFEPTAAVDNAVLVNLETTFFGAQRCLRDNPLRNLVTGPENANGIPEFVAFRLIDAVSLGYFDEHHLFAGDRGIAYELAWRLFSSGVPSLGMDHGQMFKKPLLPWWRLKLFVDRPQLLEFAKALSPKLLDDTRTEAFFPRSQRRMLVSSELPEIGSMENQTPKETIPACHRQRGLNVRIYRSLRGIAYFAEFAAWHLASRGHRGAIFTTLVAMVVKPVLVKIVPHSLYPQRCVPILRRSQDVGDTEIHMLKEMIPARQELRGLNLRIYRSLKRIAYFAEIAAWRLASYGHWRAAFTVLAVAIVKPMLIKIIPLFLYQKLASSFRRQLIRG